MGACNDNRIPDKCDIDCGTSGGPRDIPGCGESEDCNANSVPDEGDPDFDADGVPDDCDPDLDRAGVPNEDDACEFTPPGEPVNPSAGPIGDLDHDCDVTPNDYFYFWFCLGESSPGGEPGFQECLDVFHFDAEADVDSEDFGVFRRVFTGSTI